MASQSALFAANGETPEPLWAAVDDYTGQHLNHHQHLDVVLHDSVAAGLPAIATYPVLAKALSMQSYVTGVTHALEVGTLGAYTPIWLCTLNPAIKITTVEYSPRHAEVAAANCRKVLGEAWEARVEIIVGAGRDVLPRLAKEVADGSRPKFGLTYIDADKVNNWFYFDLAVRMSHPRASIYIDNIVRQGRLVAGNKIVSRNWMNAKEERGDFDESTLGAREAVEKTGKDARVEAVVLQTVSGKSWDGHIWAIVK